MRKAVAEAIGAFALVFVGTLVITSSGEDLGATALAYGLTMAVFVAALAHVSGGHFNPAVTLAMYLSRAINLRGALTYWFAQFSGGLVAALVVLMATDEEVVTAGAPALADGVGLGEAVVLEAVATFFLVLVVYGTVIDARAPFSAYPFAIGFVVTAGVFAIGPLTGGALNPARGFGPALFGVEWSAAAAWLAGPLIGGLLAWAVYEYVLAPRQEPAALMEDGLASPDELSIRGDGSQSSAARIIPGLDLDDEPALNSATPAAESEDIGVEDIESEDIESEDDVAEDEDVEPDKADPDEAEADEAESDDVDADEDERVHDKAATAASPK